MGGRNTSNLPLVGGQPFLEASQQPAFEQRGYPVAKPLTQPDRGSGLRTVHSSGVAWPGTSRSPEPWTALITVSARSPVAGLAVKATPAASAAIMRWTRTAIRAVACGA